MTFFSFYLSPLAIVLLVAILATAVAAALYGLRPLINVIRYKSPEPVPEPFADDDAPRPSRKISVVAYGYPDTDLLPSFLDSVMAQDYEDFEVIVVLDSSQEKTANISEELTGRYPNLYITFIPPGSRSLSRRKLALMVGIKAAKGEVVVLTATNCRPASKRWLGEVAAATFGARRQVALGISVDSPDCEAARLNPFLRFIGSMTTLQWLGFAISGSPYRGDGHNLAFARHLFFDNKGYARSLFLQGGEDDMFVSEITSPSNTSVMLSPDSFVVADWGDGWLRMWHQRRDRYDFISRYLRRYPFVEAGISSALQWLMLILFVAVVVFCHSTIWPVLFSLIPVALLYVGDRIIYNRAAARIRSEEEKWLVWPYMLARPFANLYWRLKSRSKQFKNYTWQRP